MFDVQGKGVLLFAAFRLIWHVYCLILFLFTLATIANSMAQTLLRT